MKYRCHTTTHYTGAGRFSWRNRLGRGAIAVLSIALAGSPSFAFAEQRGTAAQQADCMADVFRLFPTEIPDETAVLACLQSKAALLSLACHRVIEPTQQTRG